MKVKLATLSNGDIVFSELEDVNIQAKKKKVNVMVKNYLRTSLGDLK